MKLLPAAVCAPAASPGAPTGARAADASDVRIRLEPDSRFELHNGPLRPECAANLESFPAVFLKETAVLIPATILPYLEGWYGVRYLALVIPVDLVILYVLWSIWRDARPVNAGRLSRILKTDMVIGLIAICLGR